MYKDHRMLLLGMFKWTRIIIRKRKTRCQIQEKIARQAETIPISRFLSRQPDQHAALLVTPAQSAAAGATIATFTHSTVGIASAQMCLLIWWFGGTYFVIARSGSVEVDSTICHLSLHRSPRVGILCFAFASWRIVFGILNISWLLGMFGLVGVVVGWVES
jgi:hypothetical protein